MKTKVLLVITALLVGLAIAAFPGGQQAASSAQKSTVIIGIPATPVGIDPDVNAEPTGSDIMANIYDWDIGLTMRSCGIAGLEDILVPDFDGELQPALIEKWELAPDRSRCVYHLRKGVKSIYGNELTTKDIEYKWERNLALQGNGSFFMSVIGCTSKENLKVIDKYTFEVIPNNPAFLLALMWNNLFFPIWDSTEVKKHATDDDKWAHNWVATHGAGYGPYYIKEWVAGQYITLEVNPNSWRQPKVKTLIFKVIPESANRLSMVKDGTIDVAMQLTPREIDSARKAKNVRIIDLPGNAGLHVVLNQTFEPFKNKFVRQAIQWAMPQEDIAKVAFYGLARPWKAPTTTSMPGVDTAIFPYSYNLETAKKLLGKGGYGSGFDVDLFYNADLSSHETAAVLIKDSLAKIGINVSLRKTPLGTFDQGVTSRKFPFSLWIDMPITPDPIFGYMLMYLSTEFQDYCNYVNTTADQMMRNANNITDRDKRYAAAKEVEKVLLEDVPYAWAIEQKFAIAANAKLLGLSWNISNDIRYDFMSLKK
jgi:peptide/nickel transport system substrate-binding protein